MRKTEMIDHSLLLRLIDINGCTQKLASDDLEDALSSPCVKIFSMNLQESQGLSLGEVGELVPLHPPCGSATDTLFKFSPYTTNFNSYFGWLAPEHLPGIFAPPPGTCARN